MGPCGPVRVWKRLDRSGGGGLGLPAPLRVRLPHHYSNFHGLTLFVTGQKKKLKGPFLRPRKKNQVTMKKNGSKKKRAAVLPPMAKLKIGKGTPLIPALRRRGDEETWPKITGGGRTDRSRGPKKINSGANKNTASLPVTRVPMGAEKPQKAQAATKGAENPGPKKQKTWNDLNGQSTVVRRQRKRLRGPRYYQEKSVPRLVMGKVPKKPGPRPTGSNPQGPAQVRAKHLWRLLRLPPPPRP